MLFFLTVLSFCCHWSFFIHLGHWCFHRMALSVCSKTSFAAEGTQNSSSRHPQNANQATPPSGEKQATTTLRRKIKQPPTSEGKSSNHHPQKTKQATTTLRGQKQWLVRLSVACAYVVCVAIITAVFACATSMEELCYEMRVVNIIAAHCCCRRR